MRFAPFALGLLLPGVVLSSAGCERMAGWKDQLMGSTKPEGADAQELAAIRALYEGGKCDEALPMIEAAVERDPGMAEAFYYKGLCHLARAGSEPVDPRAPLSADETLGLEAFERALSVNPRHAPSSIGIGDLYSRRLAARRRRGGAGTEDPQDPYVLALAAYGRAVSIDPKLPQAQRQYAVFLERVGQLDQADSAYRAAIEAAAVVPEIAPDYYLAYGRFLAGPRDQLPEALEQFKLAQVYRQEDTTVRQEMARVYARIGLRHMEKQEYLMAEEALTQADALFHDRSVTEAQKASEALGELRTIRRR